MNGNLLGFLASIHFLAARVPQGLVKLACFEPMLIEKLIGYRVSGIGIAWVIGERRNRVFSK